MRQTLRALAVWALSHIRRHRLLHRPVHAAAVLLVRTRLFERAIRAVIEPQYPTRTDYAIWIERYEALSDDDRAAIAGHIATFTRRPLISVVMPAYDTPAAHLRAAIDSVRAQLYPHWELCVADDASTSPEVWSTLTEAAAADPRIKVVRRPANGHISAATNSALELASGEFVALMDHDDILAQDALYEVAAVIEAHPDADIIYSDEDKIDDAGRRFEPYFKTDWNPELLLGQNLVSHLGVYRRAEVEAVGGLRVGFEGSQDYDLTLRLSERTTAARIHHIPRVLYHWRQKGAGTFSETQMARCADAARRAVEEHLRRAGQPVASVSHLSKGSTWTLVRRGAPAERPLVSIIVPTRDRAELLAQCAKGVLSRTAYEPLELLVVDNDSREPATLRLFAELQRDPRVRVLHSPGAFNFPALNNQAVAVARGEIVVLLNNDISMIDPRWLDELVGQAMRPNVGAVGARLLYPDGRVQHGGVALGVGAAQPAVAAHLYGGARADDSGYLGQLRLPRNISAVTAACLALRREVYLEVGGLDAENLPVAFNDVDLCLKIRARGYDIVWTPFAELHHHESASRGFDAAPADQARFLREIAVMRERWGPALDNDPFYGPNFDLAHGDYRLASPPRRIKPWRASAD